MDARGQAASSSSLAPKQASYIPANDVSSSSPAGTDSIHSQQQQQQHKRHRLTPAEEQAIKLQKLLANPDKPITLPSAPSNEKTLRPPREMMKNVSGSSAGAGSGEFHIYKHSRRREYERVKLMEEAAARQREQEAFGARQEALQQDAMAKTNKNRAKREKKKAAKEAARAAAAVPSKNLDNAASPPSPSGEEAIVKRSASDGDAEEQNKSDGKRRRINADGIAAVDFRLAESSGDNKDNCE